MQQSFQIVRLILENVCIIQKRMLVENENVPAVSKAKCIFLLEYFKLLVI